MHRQCCQVRSELLLLLISAPAPSWEASKHPRAHNPTARHLAPQGKCGADHSRPHPRSVQGSCKQPVQKGSEDPKAWSLANAPKCTVHAPKDYALLSTIHWAGCHLKGLIKHVVTTIWSSQRPSCVKATCGLILRARAERAGEY